MWTVNRLSCACANAWTFLIDAITANDAAAAAAATDAITAAQAGGATEIRSMNENANAAGTAIWFTISTVRQQYGRQHNDRPSTNQRRFSYYYRHISALSRCLSRVSADKIFCQSICANRSNPSFPSLSLETKFHTLTQLTNNTQWQTIVECVPRRVCSTPANPQIISRKLLGVSDVFCVFLVYSPAYHLSTLCFLWLFFIVFRFNTFHLFSSFSANGIWHCPFCVDCTALDKLTNNNGKNNEK